MTGIGCPQDIQSIVVVSELEGVCEVDWFFVERSEEEEEEEGDGISEEDVESE